MVRTLVCGTVFIISAMITLPGIAAPLDDSLSPQQQININIQWKDPGNVETLDEKSFNAVVARAHNVDIRLKTDTYLGKQARIFLVLPLNVRGLSKPESLRLYWTTNGLFSDGSVTPGSRQLIFEGTIRERVMRDIFNFTFELDARDLYQTLRLEPVYDIEITAP